MILSNPRICLIILPMSHLTRAESIIAKELRPASKIPMQENKEVVINNHIQQAFIQTQRNNLRYIHNKILIHHRFLRKDIGLKLRRFHPDFRLVVRYLEVEDHYYQQVRIITTRGWITTKLEIDPTSPFILKDLLLLIITAGYILMNREQPWIR